MKGERVGGWNVGKNDPPEGGKGRIRVEEEEKGRKNERRERTHIPGLLDQGLGGCRRCRVVGMTARYRGLDRTGRRT